MKSILFKDNNSILMLHLNCDESWCFENFTAFQNVSLTSILITFGVLLIIFMGSLPVFYPGLRTS